LNSLSGSIESRVRMKLPPAALSNSPTILSVTCLILEPLMRFKYIFAFWLECSGKNWIITFFKKPNFAQSRRKSLKIVTVILTPGVNFINPVRQYIIYGVAESGL
jgi:hypothetical protein